MYRGQVAELERRITVDKEKETLTTKLNQETEVVILCYNFVVPI